MENKLLTIAQIAKELGIPESTARYYRDKFIEYIPYVGEGRSKRYRPETVEVLRFIAEGFNRNLTAMEIEEGLSRMVARNVEVEEHTATTTAAAQQQYKSQAMTMQFEVGEKFQIIMNQFTNAMEVIADQKQEIAELRKIIIELQEKQKEQERNIENKFSERDIELIKYIQGIEETKKEIVGTRKESWWRRMWNR